MCEPGRPLMTRVTEATADGVVRLENRFADGAAFVEGAYVPIAEARIPILDWGLHPLRRHLRRGPRLGRASSSASITISTASRRASPASACPSPTTGTRWWQILMRLMRLSQLRDAYVEVLCTRGMPPKGTRDPRGLREPLHRLRHPLRLDRGRGDARARHQPAPELLPAHSARLGGSPPPRTSIGAT